MNKEEDKKIIFTILIAAGIINGGLSTLEKETLDYLETRANDIVERIYADHNKG